MTINETIQKSIRHDRIKEISKELIYSEVTVNMIDRVDSYSEVMVNIIANMKLFRGQTKHDRIKRISRVTRLFRGNG